MHVLYVYLGLFQELSEARDALLKQIDEAYHQQEKVQEELLLSSREQDRLSKENTLLSRRLEAYDANATLGSAAEHSIGEEWRVKVGRRTGIYKHRAHTRMSRLGGIVPPY